MLRARADDRQVCEVQRCGMCHSSGGCLSAASLWSQLLHEATQAPSACSAQVELRAAVKEAFLDEVFPELRDAPVGAPAVEAQPTAAVTAGLAGAAAEAGEEAEAEAEAEGEAEPEPDPEGEQLAYEEGQLQAVDNAATATVGLSGAAGWDLGVNKNFDKHMQSTMQSAWDTGKALHPGARNVGQVRDPYGCGDLAGRLRAP